METETRIKREMLPKIRGLEIYNCSLSETIVGANCFSQKSLLL